MGFGSGGTCRPSPRHLPCRVSFCLCLLYLFLVLRFPARIAAGRGDGTAPPCRAAKIPITGGNVPLGTRTGRPSASPEARVLWGRAQGCLPHPPPHTSPPPWGSRGSGLPAPCSSSPAVMSPLWSPGCWVAAQRAPRAPSRVASGDVGTPGLAGAGSALPAKLRCVGTRSLSPGFFRDFG